MMDISRDEYRKAYAEAPVLVQDAVDSEETLDLILALQSKYALHIDITTILGKKLGHLLLGLVNPTEFNNSLISSGISTTIAAEIIKEVNEKIFQPLQKRMRQGGSVADIRNTDSDLAQERSVSSLPDSSMPTVRTGTEQEYEKTPITISPAAIVTSEPLISDKTVTSIHSISSIGNQSLESPVLNPVFAAQRTVLKGPVQQVEQETASIEPYLPYARTMAEDMERAAHGLTGQPATPARSFQTASVPVTYTAPQPAFMQAPAYAPSQPVPVQMPAVAAPQFSQQTASQYAPQPQFNPHPTPAAEQSFVAAPPSIPAVALHPVGQRNAEPTVRPAGSSFGAPPVMAPIRLTPVDRAYAPDAPITKEYGSDPYREPISG